MTVRIKSEYQRRFRVPHPGRAPPVRGVPSAGLRSDHMGTSREPCVQRRRRLGGRTQSRRSPLPPSDPGPAQAPGRAPPADLLGSSAHRKDPKPATAPGPEEPEPPEASGRHPGSQPAANMTSGGRRSGGRTSEYRRQFSSKKPGAAVSAILTADQVLNSSRKAVAMETEYRQSYQDPVPPAKPRLRKHLEAQRIPLFHVHMDKKTKASQKKPHGRTAPSHHRDEATPPAQVQRPRRLTEYQSSFRSPLRRILEEGGATHDHASQAAALRRQAQCYRRRAWGVNFCREHLNQLQSDHTGLWEPAQSPATPPEPAPPRQDRGLRLALNSSQSSETEEEPKGEETSEEEEPEQEEEGRLPTPRLKMLPVQRTHHDLTTPATGGALLVGRDSPGQQVAVGAGAVTTPPRCKEAWSEVDATHVTPGVSSPVHQSAVVKSPEPLLAPPPPDQATPPHCIQGSLRKPDFQHNGELGLRFRDPPCPGGGCGSDPGDRLSVMSWRSAASCSEASAVLERARRRRDHFWGR